MESSGPRGCVVGDLVEVHPGEVEDKLAISYFRFCDGLRLYRSASVSKALRLVCSAPVPGLGETTYMDVFREMTKSDWEWHMYLKGGMVRDILRRIVGNDIDTSFTAPVNELGKVCDQQGYPCEYYDSVNYFFVGDRAGDEFLEGVTLYHEGGDAYFYADFSMNTLLYDFCNDLVIDRFGIGVPAVLENRVGIPQKPASWAAWLRVKGLQGLFRYYKFLLRGYTHDASEMAWITGQLLRAWEQDPEDTVQNGQRALKDLVGCTDAAKLEGLRQLVSMSFGEAPPPPGPDGGSGRLFTSAELWWRRGWRPMLKLGDDAPQP